MVLNVIYKRYQNPFTKEEEEGFSTYTVGPWQTLQPCFSYAGVALVELPLVFIAISWGKKEMKKIVEIRCKKIIYLFGCYSKDSPPKI